ncbi:hypothetical protein [Rhodopirellula baltica]
MKHLTLLAVLIMTAHLSACDSFGQEVFVSTGEWRISEDQKATLQAPYVGRGITICAPEGFAPIETPQTAMTKDARVSVVSFTNDPHAKLRPSLVIMMLPHYPDGQNKDEAYLDGFADKLRSAWTSPKVESQRTGRINGSPCRQLRFSGTMPNGETIHGFSLALTDNVGRISINAMVPEAQIDLLDKMAISSLTIQRNNAEGSSE